jgi:hypothetical protein
VVMGKGLRIKRHTAVDVARLLFANECAMIATPVYNTLDMRVRNASCIGEVD